MQPAPASAREPTVNQEVKDSPIRAPSSTSTSAARPGGLTFGPTGQTRMKGLYFASWASVAALALCIALAGCAAMPGGHHEPSDDPLEPLNRVVLDTNTALDNAFIKPMAEIYRQIVPQLVRDRIRDAI